MKKTTLIKSCLICTVVVFFATGCARLPSNQSASKILKHQYAKYGKKYKDSVLGSSKVSTVQIDGMDEIHKHYVAVYAYVNLVNGTQIKTRNTLQKKTLGWKFVSWENLANDPQQGLSAR